jgi:hypothetical protein
LVGWLREQVRDRDVQQGGKACKRAYSQVLTTAFDTLKVLHREMARVGKTFLGHASRGAQFGHPTPKVPQQVVRTRTGHPPG